MPALDMIAGGYLDVWTVRLDGVLLAVFASKDFALRFSALVAAQRNAKLVIHYHDGSIEEGQDYVRESSSGAGQARWHK